MVDPRFFQITLSFVTERPPEKILERAFDRALDWFKYAPNCWIVWTTSDAEKWYERLRPLIGDADSLFIVALDIEERQGWMPQRFWDWLRKKR